MKIKTLLLSVALAVTVITSSRAQTNITVNIIGGGYNLLCNPLDSGTNTVDHLFSSFPDSTLILTWDPVNAEFLTITRSFGAHWNPPIGDRMLPPGAGFFISTPSNVSYTFSGFPLQGNLTNSMVAGYNLVGNLAPVGGTVNDIGLTNVPNGTQILQWDPIGQAFNTTHTKTAFGFGWNPPTLPSFNVAEGFFMNVPAPFDWTQYFVVE
jgi:hypothetical protein